MPDEPLDDPDNPLWTAEDFARARPLDEMFPPEVVAQLVRPSTPALSGSVVGQASWARGLRLAA